MWVLICLRESGLVGMGAMFGGDVIQSRFKSAHIDVYEVFFRIYYGYPQDVIGFLRRVP